MSSDNRTQHIRMLRGAAMEGCALLIGVLAFLVSAGCGGSTSATTGNSNSERGGPVAATLSGTVKVGTAPSAIAVDSTSDKIYVTDFGTKPPSGVYTCPPSGADIMVIDGATQSATSIGLSTRGSLNPYAVTVNPTNHTFYVLVQISLQFPCTFDGNGIEMFDTASLSKIKNLGFWGGGSAYTGIGVNPNTGTIYVADPEGNSAVLLFDSNSGAYPLATIPVGAGPIAVNATTNEIYVVNSGSNNISVIDGTSNSVIATITDPNAVAPVAVAVNATTNTVFVVNAHSNNLTVIDGAIDSVTATIPVGTSPSGVDVDSQTNFIYVANTGNPQSGDLGNITVIDGAKHTTTTLTDPKAVNPSAIAANSVTHKIYVANSGSNNVTVIDGAHD